MAMRYCLFVLLLLVTAAPAAVAAADFDRPQIVWITLGETAGDVTINWISSDIQPVRSVVEYQWIKGVVSGAQQPSNIASGKRVELGTAHGRRYWVHHVPLSLGGIGIIELTIPTTAQPWRYHQRRGAEDRAFVLPPDGLTVNGTYKTVGLLPVRVALAGDLGRDGDKVAAALQQVGKQRPQLVILAGNLTDDRGATGEPQLQRWLELLDALTHSLADDNNQLPAIAALPGYFDIDIKAPRSAERATWLRLFFPQIEQLPRAITLGPALRLLLLDAGYTQTIASQNAWLEQQLNDAAYDGFTVPVYSESAYPAAKKADSLGSLVIRRQWGPQFDGSATPLVVEHWDQAYKRTQPLFHEHPAPGGTLYVGGGGLGSNRLEDVARPGWGGLLGNRRGYLAVSERVGHFVLLSVTPDQLNITATADDGRQVDAFAIDKNKPATIVSTYVSKPHERGEVWILTAIAVGVVLVWLLSKD